MSNRTKYLLNTYGLSQVTYGRMVAYSSNRCYICRRKPKKGKRLYIDHDHHSQQIRGLLCWLCNKYLIGRRRKEHAYLFKAAARYLEIPPLWGFIPKRKRK